MKIYCGIFWAVLAISGWGNDLAVTHPLSVRIGCHENQDWFEFRGFHYTDERKDLPRVLLIGDSISGGYRSGVQSGLGDAANVTWLTMCYCVSAPNFMKLLDLCLSDTEYSVIHFNNGLHACRTIPAVYEAKLREALELIRRRQPRAKIVWARTTPVADRERNACVWKLNEIADRVVAEMNVDRINDLYTTMMSVPVDRRWADGCHPGGETLELLVLDVLDSIRPFVPKRMQPGSEKCN